MWINWISLYKCRVTSFSIIKFQIKAKESMKHEIPLNLKLLKACLLFSNIILVFWIYRESLIFSLMSAKNSSKLTALSRIPLNYILDCLGLLQPPHIIDLQSILLLSSLTESISNQYSINILFILFPPWCLS